jgi:hypothetical protein
VQAGAIGRSACGRKVQKPWLGSDPGWPAECTCPPSSLKHDCDRSTTRTGEGCLMKVHAKSCLSPETENSAAASAPWMTWAYTRRVMAGSAWPSRAATT